MTMPAPKSKILLPLYIYPDPGAWEPLFSAVASNPGLEFIVIVNPNNGPGSEPWWPNVDYVREIPRLNECPNVKTVGYVSTAYCKRPIEEVLVDVEKYASWPRDARFPGLGVSGVFFDETPNVFGEEERAYLDAVTGCVKRADGIFGERTVIHNPGTSIDSRLAIPDLDISTVAEIAHSNFQITRCREWLATSPFERERTSVIIHGVHVESIEDLVTGSLRDMAGYVFVTDQETEVYHSFGRSWEVFVDAMGRT